MPLISAAELDDILLEDEIDNPIIQKRNMRKEKKERKILPSKFHEEEQ